MELQKITDRNREEAIRFLTGRWGSDRMVSGGHVWELAELDGFVTVEGGEITGAVTYRPAGVDCEIVSLDGAPENRGAGTALLNAAVRAAGEKGCRRVFLFTTNDNTRAIRFYQKRGFDMAGFFRNSVEKARKIKPEIPKTGDDGIPIRHEIEFEFLI